MEEITTPTTGSKTPLISKERVKEIILSMTKEADEEKIKNVVDFHFSKHFIDKSFFKLRDIEKVKNGFKYDKRIHKDVLSFKCDDKENPNHPGKINLSIFSGSIKIGVLFVNTEGHDLFLKAFSDCIGFPIEIIEYKEESARKESKKFKEDTVSNKPKRDKTKYNKKAILSKESATTKIIIQAQDNIIRFQQLLLKETDQDKIAEINNFIIDAKKIIDVAKLELQEV